MQIAYSHGEFSDPLLTAEIDFLNSCTAQYLGVQILNRKQPILILLVLLAQVTIIVVYITTPNTSDGFT